MKEGRDLKRKKLSPRLKTLTRIDVYETLCPQQMLVHKSGKIKNWGGECRDTYKIAVSKYQGRCEQRSEVFVKTFFFFFFFVGAGGSGQVGGGGGGVGRGGSGWGVRVDVNEELKFL